MQQIGDVIVNNTDNLLISSFVGIASVGCYSNYYLLIGSVQQVLNETFQGITASVGNLGATASKERVQTSPSGDAPYVRTVSRIVDLNRRIQEEIDDFVDRKHKIINQIQGLDNPNYIKLLFKRYVEFKKFEEIAFELDFTYQYTIELHGYALKEFEKTYLTQWKPMSVPW